MLAETSIPEELKPGRSARNISPKHCSPYHTIEGSICSTTINITWAPIKISTEAATNQQPLRENDATSACAKVLEGTSLCDNRRKRLIVHQPKHESLPTLSPRNRGITAGRSDDIRADASKSKRFQFLGTQRRVLFDFFLNEQLRQHLPPAVTVFFLMVSNSSRMKLFTQK